MTSHRQVATSLLMIAVAALVGAFAWRLATDKPAAPATAAKAPPPANVAKVVKEEALATVTLTEEALNRLGVKTAPLERKTLRRVRFYGGEAMIPTGKAVIVSAPLAGIVRAPAAGLKQVGRDVKKGEALLMLSPLLSPEARTMIAAQMVDAEGQENNARTTLEATTIALDRARKLLRDEAGSRRNVDEAQAAYEVASKTLEAAAARKSILTKIAGELHNGTASPLPIDAPSDGILRNLNAMPGQAVASGAALFEVADMQTIWLRVPVPVSDMSELARDQEALVGPLVENRAAPKLRARSIPAPPTANALSGTVDLYYEMSNAKNETTPAERLGVEIPLKQAAESLVVSSGAVVYDIHGNSWVYEQTAPRTYVRRRVAVDHLVDNMAVLANGPKAGTVVVVEGAIELFAAETGFIK